MRVPIPGFRSYYRIDTETGQVFSMAKSEAGVRMHLNAAGKLHLQRTNGQDSYIFPQDALAMASGGAADDTLRAALDEYESRVVRLNRQVAKLKALLHTAKTADPWRHAKSVGIEKVTDCGRVAVCKNCQYFVAAKDGAHKVLLDKLDALAARLLLSRSEVAQLKREARPKRAAKGRPGRQAFDDAGVPDEWDD